MRLPTTAEDIALVEKHFPHLRKITEPHPTILAMARQREAEAEIARRPGLERAFVMFCRKAKLRHFSRRTAFMQAYDALKEEGMIQSPKTEQEEMI